MDRWSRSLWIVGRKCRPGIDAFFLVFGVRDWRPKARSQRWSLVFASFTLTQWSLSQWRRIPVRGESWRRSGWFTAVRFRRGSPLPREKEYQRHQRSGEPCQNGYVQDKQICDRRPCHDGGNLQAGPETEFWDQDPNSAADFQNAGEVAKPLTDSDLCKLPNHVGIADQFSSAGSCEHCGHEES